MQGIQKQMVNWIWPIGYNLPNLELECNVIQGAAHTSFSPGLHDFVEWRFGALFIFFILFSQTSYNFFLLNIFIEV